MAAPVLQLRVPEDTLARIDQARGDDTRSAWVLRLIGRELEGPQPTAATSAGKDLALPVGEPSPGAVCATPSCWQNNTRKYGLRQLPLCDACAAALQGQDYKRQVPETAARAIRRGVALTTDPGDVAITSAATAAPAGQAPSGPSVFPTGSPQRP